MFDVQKVELMSAISLEQSLRWRQPQLVRLAGEALGTAQSQLGASAQHADRHPNPIVQWVLERGCDLAAYMDQLLKFDQRMGGDTGTPFTLARVRRRLSLALFLDYARDQGLSADEMASLMDDAQQTASEAMSFLIAAARRTP